jgi:hypothetical protein
MFEMLNKKMWANFQRIIELLTQKLSLSSQKYGFGIRDPGSGKNLFQIPDPGSRGQKGTGSRIPDPDPQHCEKASTPLPPTPFFRFRGKNASRLIVGLNFR